MAHVILLRSTPSFVQPTDNVVYGTHERIELAINSRKYNFEGPMRKGYNIPHACEWHLMEYRIKKECIPEFVRDLGGNILNPEVNTSSIFKIMGVKSNCDANIKINRSMLFAQYIFKWINRINKIVRILPIKPVPTPAPGKAEPFTNNTGWHYTFILGILPDIETEHGEEL